MNACRPCSYYVCCIVLPFLFSICLSLPPPPFSLSLSYFSQQLEGVHEDFRQHEARWGATQSRLRLKIQSLEKENQELRNDLKMMEQTRLQMWQKQVYIHIQMYSVRLHVSTVDAFQTNGTCTCASTSITLTGVH